MEEKTPYTVTLRRNPHRLARPTPGSALPPFPLQDILDIEIPENRQPPPSLPTPTETLKVFLRVRPLTLPSSRNAHNKNAWPKNPKPKTGVKPKCRKVGSSCIAVRDENSIAITPPLGLQDTRRGKSEVYEGFQNVFASEATQVEVYEKLLKPLVADFLKGKSGMLAAVGPSGSGKTHTMFGCVREPGMVPLALSDIFSSYESKPEEEPRTLYMSMFEISSEKGKSERISDLLQGVPEISKQHSTVKGVEQVIIEDAQQAEILLASGLLKRATAGTNANSQSSRSQCIINFQQATRKADDQDDYSELTIVDLAGAEREKRTGNQGTRLLESNFINNTSMVFGLCLRALLEHQKNPKRQLQKHFQNSMLTRYLRDYLEGKKRMSLILTVKPSEEDYLDTSFVLRQAAPYMQIKFSNVEQPNNLISKRPLQTLNRPEPLKRRKHPRLEVSEIKYEKIPGDPHIIEEDHATGGIEDANLLEISINSEESSSVSLKKRLQTFAEADRNHKVLEGLSKAIWKVLKEYNKKLKETQQENCILNAELAKERKRCSDLESSIQDVKFRCSCRKEASKPNIYDHENLQKPSAATYSSKMEGSNQNNNNHPREFIEKTPSAYVPSNAKVEISMQCSPQPYAGTSSENVSHRPSHESSDRRTKSCLRSREGLDKTTESFSNGENKNHFIDKLKADVNCSDEEACISPVSGIRPLTNFDDSEELDKTTASYSSGENKNHFIDKLKADVHCCDEEACISPVSGIRPLTNFDDSGDSGALDKTTKSYSNGENKKHFIDKLKADVYCSDEEACLSPVSGILPLTNFDDSVDSEDSINEKSPCACVPSKVMVEISKRRSPQAATSSENVNYRSNNEASDKLTYSCLRSSEGLDKTNESYSSGKYGNHVKDELKAAMNCSDEEACISSVLDLNPLTNFDDSVGSLDIINLIDVRREYMHHSDQNFTIGNTTNPEISGLAGSAALLPDSSKENFTSCEEEQQFTCSSNLESVASSSQTPNSTTDDISLLTKDKELEKLSQIQESFVPPVSGTSTEDATCNKKCDSNNVSVAAGISSLTKDSQNLPKVKRRLLPVSSLLLKDMSSLAIEDETEKRKGARVDKKVAFDEKIKTQNKTSLLQLLQRNVVR